ncbi:MAG TPA: hypothetical protein P5071_02030 [Paludibacteraceae bacterium]|nr:hypothetical protein [Paludibacteraceae bacterium]HRR62599.1 hypothetical protein [Paludibacteraceae bacterium]
MAGIGISIYELLSKSEKKGNSKKKQVIYNGVLLIILGIYLLITKMFLEKTLLTISWLIGVFVIVGIIRKSKKNQSNLKT